MRTGGSRAGVFGLATAGLLALAEPGCGHGTATRGGESAAAEVLPSATFQEAYEAVQRGLRETARYGEYVLDRAGQGAVRIYREARDRVEDPEDRLSDEEMEAEVKARLLAEHGARAKDVEVEADAGVVTLRGAIDDPDEAARLARTALEARGVYAGDSRLRAKRPEQVEPKDRGATAPGPGRM